MFTETLSVTQVSELFGVNGDTVRRMIRDGRLKATKGKKSYSISAESVKQLVEEGKKKHDSEVK